MLWFGRNTGGKVLFYLFMYLLSGASRIWTVFKRDFGISLYKRDIRSGERGAAKVGPTVGD